MQHIQGIARNQLQVSSLEDTISQDNPVRFNSQTQSMELTLQEKRFVFDKNDLFKAIFSSYYFGNK
ncbi:hypothetical protein [Flavobacterium macrobrachii]|uniref:hypothetical protein n=1 Tax=Flavobacterium macrobrachii TaxID=591204 RepID=UPI003F710E87